MAMSPPRRKSAMPCATPNACMRVFSAARTMCLCASPRLDEESRIFLSLEYPLGASERSAASKRAPPCHSFARRRMTHPAGGENFRSHPGSTEESRPPLDDGHHGLGPFFGSLPPDVLRELLLPKLDVLSRVLFARAAGACWRAMKDSGLSCRVEKGVVCSLAASGGHLECLRYAHEHGCPWKADTCTYAARQGRLECLRYAHEHSCPWDADTCAQAADNGQLECLRYARNNGCPWDAVTCAWAAGRGHLECLRYAHEHGCPWNADTCTYAARQGHLECLRYARNNGCPWKAVTCAWAAGQGHLECLRYAHEHGCPWDADTCAWAAGQGHLECLRYARNHGCPCPEEYCHL